jgi:hypothetical protein
MDGSDYTQGMNLGINKMGDTMTGMRMGLERMVSDVGGMMPEMASHQMHPFIQARHGMYAHEMSMSGDIASIFGKGIPKTTTAYEYQELASRDLGQRIGTGLTMGAFHGTAALASWHAATVPMGAGWKAGKAMGGAMAAARGLKAGGMAAGALATGAGLVGGALGLAPVLALDATVGKIADDIGHRRDIMGYLEASSFRYAQGTGKDIDQKMGGFNVSAQQKIASAIKQVDLGDSFYDMNDLKGVLESGTQLGMFSGTSDADEFANKFKNLTETLKKVTKTLHTSLADGMKVIKDLKDQGYTMGNDMNSAIMTADVLGSATGKTAAEMLTYGRQGAEMVRGTGIGMSTGSSMFQNTMANVSMLASSGALSGEMVRQAGGEGALAQQMMGSNINLMQSRFGRGMMMAMTDAQGNFNAGAMGQFAGGDSNLRDIANAASGNMPNPAAYIKQVINQEKNMRQMAEQFGGEGINIMAASSNMMMGREISSRYGVSTEEGMRFYMKSQGMSESVIEAQISQLQNVDKLKANRINALRNTAKKAQSEILQEKLDITGRIGDAVDEFIAPVSEGISNISDKISGAVSSYVNEKKDQFMAYATGTEMVEGMSMTRVESQKAILRGLPDDAGADSMYTSSIFSEAESDSFAKTKGYDKLRGKYAGKEMSDSAINATTINDFSKAITGRPWGSLTREEKMYVEVEATRSGRTEIKQQLDERQDAASMAARNQMLRSVKDVMETKEKAEQDVEGTRADIIKKSFTPRVQDALDDALQDKEGKAKFDELIQLKAEVGKVDIKNLGSLSKKEQLDVAKKMSRIDILKRDIFKNMPDSAARKQFLKGLETMDYETAGDRLSKAKEVLATATKDAQGTQIVRSTAQQLLDVDTSSLDSGFLGMGGDASEFKDMSRDIANMIMGEGDLGDDFDYNKASKLAAKAGYGNLSGALSQASKITEPVTDMKQIRKLLGVGKEISNEEIKKFISQDKEEGLSRQELLKFKVADNLADRTGSPNLITTERGDNAVGEKSAEVVRSLTDTQSKISTVMNQLEVLASRLEKKTGVRAN